MTILAHDHPPGHEERRHHTQDRQRVIVIGAMWAALTLLAVVLALLQPDEPVPAPAPVATASQGVSTGPDTAPRAPAASGAVPGS